ncbi:hypothetical protein GIB67_038541 [Kingdonia uniflora]|uniref:Uncharacterized protein n=1 Tax=Kingdonia uniflora TaxID=39325 RepID=A0A7J7NPY9_9MAGN|nr:hypothetical protein GIB67_038541 [Kingdonia uniflora]
MDESTEVTVQGKQLDEIDTNGRTMEDFPLKRVLFVLEKPDTVEAEGKNRCGKEKREQAVRASEKDNHSSEPLSDVGHPQDASGITSKAVRPKS